MVVSLACHTSIIKQVLLCCHVKLPWRRRMQIDDCSLPWSPSDLRLFVLALYSAPAFAKPHSSPFPQHSTIYNSRSQFYRSPPMAPFSQVIILVLSTYYGVYFSVYGQYVYRVAWADVPPLPRLQWYIRSNVTIVGGAWDVEVWNNDVQWISLRQSLLLLLIIYT